VNAHRLNLARVAAVLVAAALGQPADAKCRQPSIWRHRHQIKLWNILRRLQRALPPGRSHILRVKGGAMQRHIALHFLLARQRTDREPLRQLRCWDRIIERLAQMQDVPLVAHTAQPLQQGDALRLVLAGLHEEAIAQPMLGHQLRPALQRPGQHRLLNALLPRRRMRGVIQPQPGQVQQSKPQQPPLLILPEPRIFWMLDRRRAEPIGQIDDMELLRRKRLRQIIDALNIARPRRGAHTDGHTKFSSHLWVSQR